MRTINVPMHFWDNADTLSFQLAPNGPFWMGYFRACKDAEFMSNKQIHSLAHLQTDTQLCILVLI